MTRPPSTPSTTNIGAHQNMWRVVMLMMCCGVSFGACTGASPKHERRLIQQNPPTIKRLEAELASGNLSVAQRIEHHVRLGKLWLKDDVYDDLRSKRHNTSAIDLWLKHHPTQPTLKQTSAELIAEALFQNGELARRAFEGLTVDAMELSDLKGQVQEKVTAFSKASQLYLRINQHCTQYAKTSHWQVAALVRMGEMSEHLARVIEQVPPPENLSEPQKEMFSQQLSQMADPIVKRAITYYEQALTVSHDTTAITTWKRLARKQLCTIDPSRCQP